MKSKIVILVVILSAVLFISCGKIYEDFTYEQLVEIFATLTHCDDENVTTLHLPPNISVPDFKYIIPLLDNYNLYEIKNQQTYERCLMEYRDDPYKWRKFIEDCIMYFKTNFIDNIKDPIIKFYEVEEFNEDKKTFVQDKEINPATISSVPTYWMVYYFRHKNLSGDWVDDVYKTEHYENKMLKYRCLYNHHRRWIYKIFYDNNGGISNIRYSYAVKQHDNDEQFWEALDDGYEVILDENLQDALQEERNRETALQSEEEVVFDQEIDNESDLLSDENQEEIADDSLPAGVEGERE